MRRVLALRQAAVLAIGLAAVLSPAGSGVTAAAPPEATVAGSFAGPAEQKALDAYGKLPLAFAPNAGQTDPRVRFSAHTGGARFYFTQTEAVLAFNSVSSREAKGLVLCLAFLGANPRTTIEGQQLGTGKVNYFLGNDPAEWRTGLPTYGEVVYRELWPGIDMVFRGDATRLKYEFVVQPGAKVDDIRLAYRGADRLSVDQAGKLLLHTGVGTLEDARPVTYQDVRGTRVPVESSFRLDPDARQAAAYGFAVGGYDAGRPLVIDPGIVYSTFLGGGSTDLGNPIAVDAAGNAYVTGLTTSTNFPTTTGAFDVSQNGGDDAFVTKLDPTGSALVYSTYLGGSGSDEGLGIRVDTSGSAYLTGRTASTNFPTLLGFDTSHNGGDDAFVTKLDATGSALLYSTYLGGGGTDIGSSIAVDGAGNAHVTGRTNSSSPGSPFGMTGGFDTSYNGGFDVFVTKLNPTLAGVASRLYSTYLGGGGDDRGFGIALDGAGNTYVTGDTNSSSGVAMMGGFDTSQNGGFDVFVTKFNTTLTLAASRVYSTYLGGGGDDRGFSIAIDGSGSAYVTGETNSSSGSPFGMAGGFDITYNSGFDVFVTKLNAAGSARVYSTYLGGSGDDRGFGIALDSAGGAHVTGETNSSGFPTTPGAFDTTQNGIDAFVTELNPAGSAPLTYSTFLGGGNADRGFGIAVDGLGNAYVTGVTSSSDFPTTFLAFDTMINGNEDAFVTKLDMIGAPTALTLTPAADTNPVGTSHTVTATVTNFGGNPVSGVTVRFSVTGANTATGSATTNASGQATFTYTGTNTGADAIHAYADTNNNNVQNTPPEPFGDATKAWTPPTPATVTLNPAADTNPVGTSHTVTATVKDVASNPVANVTVRFTVTGSVNTSGQCTTNTAGQCNFTYTGPTAPGADTINAYADTDGDTTQDAGEPSAVPATKAWTPAAPAFVTLSPPADSNPVGTDHTVTATVTDAFTNPTPGIVVRFAVTGSVTTTGMCTTDLNGQCDFTYTGPTAPGADTINAYADTDGDNTQDAGEPSAVPAAKTWTPGAPDTLVLTPTAATNTAGTSHTVTATVEDAFGNPTPGITVRFSVTLANTASGSDTTDANGEATFTYTGNNAGGDAIHAYADTDTDNTQDLGEPFGDATKTWTPGAPATLVLSPTTDSNVVGEEHCVTGTVEDAFGNPVPGVTVYFEVTPFTFPSPASGSTTTNSSGEAEFCYKSSLPGEDAITAFADTNDNEEFDAGEPTGAATKTWTPPASTDFCEVKITQGGWIIAMNGDRASFGGNAKVDGDGNVTGQEQYTDHGPADPRNVHSIELLATTCSEDMTEASIYGTATVDGAGSFVFRIDVTDMGEPGNNDSYGITMSDLYVSGQQQLQGGNVKIHKLN